MIRLIVYELKKKTVFGCSDFCYKSKVGGGGVSERILIVLQ